jgi:hypothetical protein
MENNQTETRPERRGQAQAFVLMCGPKHPGSERDRLPRSGASLQFLRSLGIVESAVAERYRKGEGLRNIRVPKLSLTQQ